METQMDHIAKSMDGLNVARKKTGYFSLPAELRNRIMTLALVPGDVFPSLPPSTSKNSPSQSPQSNIGVQFLATNHQAYDEGRALFYSLNTFHMPDVSNQDSETILQRYQPENLALVRHVKASFKVKVAKEAVGWMDEEDWALSDDELDSALYYSWMTTLMQIQRYFRNLDSLTLERDLTLEREEDDEWPAQIFFQGSDLQFEMGRLSRDTAKWNGGGIISSTPLIFTSNAAWAAYKQLRSLAAEIGWEHVQESLLS